MREHEPRVRHAGAAVLFLLAAAAQRWEQRPARRRAPRKRTVRDRLGTGAVAETKRRVLPK